MDVMHNQSSNQDLLCCRACLATDCRLYNIHENKLADAFSRISGTPVLKDQLPQYLCTYCCCLLLKCASFRATCLATQNLLILNLLNGELNTYSIRKLDRPSHRLNLTLSVVNILEYVETPTVEIKQEPNDVVNTDEPAIDTAIKSVGNIEIGDGNLSGTSRDDDNIGVSSVSGGDIDPVDAHSNKQNADSIIERVTKKNEVKIYDSFADYEENTLMVNRVKTIKTYKKKIGTTTKKKLIEIQGHSDKVNVKTAKSDVLGQTSNDVVNLSEPHIDDIILREAQIVDTNLSEPHIDDDNLSEPHIDDDNLSEPHLDDDNLSEPHIDDDNLSEPHLDDDNLSEPHIDDDNLSEPHIDDDNLSEPHIDDDNLSKPYIDDNNLSEPHIDDDNLSEPHIDDDNLSEPYIDDDNLSEPHLDDDNLSEPHIDDDNLSEPHIDDDNLSEPHIDDDNLSKPYIDDDNLSEPHIDDDNLSEPHIDDDNLSKPHRDDVNLSEPHIDDDNLSEPHIDDENLSEPHRDDVNLSEPHIDDDNLSEPHIDDENLSEPHRDDVNLSEPHIDDDNLSEPYIDDDNLSEPQIDALNFSEPHIDDFNLSEPHIDVINVSEPHIDDAHIDIVDVQEIIKKSDSKKRVNKEVKKDTVKSKDNIENDEEGTCLNKVKPIKTYTRKKITAMKKNIIEIQGYSDLVNDKIDKDEAVIDLKEADLDKIKRNITVRYTNPDLAEDESDIEDINEIKAHIKIVNIKHIVRKALKKPKTTVKKKISDNAVKPVKRRRKKKRRFRGPENDYMPVFDFSKVERDLDVKIVTLSKQEQLEEIAERKKSRNYTASQYKCEDCGKGFDADVTYNNHRRRHSPSAGSEPCSICSLRYKRPGIRHRHEDLHRFKFICQECGEVTRNRWSAKAHHDIHKGRWFACKHCDKQFRKRQSCLSHVRLAHAALNVACDICGETFVSDIGLLMHKSITHPETKSQQFKCTTCSASFVSLDALNKHTDSGEHAGRPCEQCGESCASEDALRAHVGERHASESHWCEKCCARFSSGAAFDVHYRRMHLNERAVPARRAAKLGSPARYNRREQSMCEQCGYIAASLAVLRVHQNRHLAVKPYPCPHCPKAFPTKTARTWHIRRHTGERPYKCPDCPMTFNMRGNQKRHHNVVHLRIHAFATACHICARVFTTRSSMRLHVDAVHNGQPWPRRNRKRKQRT